MELAHDVEVAATLNRVLRIVDVGFISLEASLTAPAPPVRLSYTHNLLEVLWDSEGDGVVAVYRVQISLEAKEEPEGEALEFGQASVAARSRYRANSLSPGQYEAIPHFLGLTGWMHVWPYIRAEVQTLTAKLGLPPLTLPFLLHGQTSRTPVRRVPAAAAPAELEAEES